MPTFPFSEKYLSQIPALQQLINLGYQYLPPAQAMMERGGRASNVLLENILRDQLKKINRIPLQRRRIPVQRGKHPVRHPETQNRPIRRPAKNKRSNLRLADPWHGP